MTKELEAIERAQALAERIRLQCESAHMALFLAELSQLAQRASAPLGLAWLEEEEPGAPARAASTATPADAPETRTAPKRPETGGAAEAQRVQVAFYGAGEDMPDPAALASTVVLARVVGDALMDFRGRTGMAPQPPEPRERGDVDVEMMPSDSSQAAQLTLRHAEFGQVRVRVDMSGSRMSLRVELINARASRAMARAEPVLRDALREHGVSLEKFHLSVRGARPVHRVKTQHVLDEEA